MTGDKIEKSKKKKRNSEALTDGGKMTIRVITGKKKGLYITTKV